MYDLLGEARASPTALQNIFLFFNTIYLHIWLICLEREFIKYWGQEQGWEVVKPLEPVGLTNSSCRIYVKRSLGKGGYKLNCPFPVWGSQILMVLERRYQGGPER